MSTREAPVEPCRRRSCSATPSRESHLRLRGFGGHIGCGPGRRCGAMVNAHAAACRLFDRSRPSDGRRRTQTDVPLLEWDQEPFRLAHQSLRAWCRCCSQALGPVLLLREQGASWALPRRVGLGVDLRTRAADTGVVPGSTRESWPGCPPTLRGSRACAFFRRPDGGCSWRSAGPVTAPRRPRRPATATVRRRLGGAGKQGAGTAVGSG